MKTHNYEKHAAEYAELGFEGTFYLAFRDVPEIIQRNVHGTRALDYGCGPGRSTRLLKSLGFDVAGVDTSQDMLAQALDKDPAGDYRLITSGHIPFEEVTFDLVFSSFVFLEVSTLEEIGNILAEMKRVLKHDGSIVIVTSPPECYKGDWVSISYDFPENEREILSGEMMKLLIRGTEVELHDYYWTEDDYAQIFGKVGLQAKETHKPLGHDDDPYDWRDEKDKPAMLIYVLGKKVPARKTPAPRSKGTGSRSTTQVRRRTS
jgi:ubiquinone/menaquinone biosynthesis C-methylase UbiE